MKKNSFLYKKVYTFAKERSLESRGMTENDFCGALSRELRFTRKDMKKVLKEMRILFYGNSSKRKKRRLR